MQLGFNLSIYGKTVAQVQAEITAYSKLSTDAIELSLVVANGILEFPFAQIYPLLRKFKYISLHLPVVEYIDLPNQLKTKRKQFLNYPNTDLVPQLTMIKQIARDLNINTYVLHPDQVTDFEWATQEFGDLLGFENMDSRKNFGKTVADMQQVFHVCPQAKWIFDINHLFTNDQSLQSASAFFEAFHDRLSHYHISAFGGFHDSFVKNPDELHILSAISDLSRPMIHEGFDFDGHNAKELEKEYNLIKQNLLQV